jgi:predicted nucleic acid-binding protein
MAAVLIDTNVIVYAHDRSEPEKQLQAIQVLNALQTSGWGRVPTQALSEFLRVSTRGERPMLTVSQARRQIDIFAQTWDVFETTVMVVQEAVRGVQDHRLAFYDAQIWASARLNQVPVIFSEDFANGSNLEGVRFINPFADEFRLEQWLV